LLPSLNRKLCGKEYSSLAHAVKARRLRSGSWERLRGVHMEKTGSNMEEEGKVTV